MISKSLELSDYDSLGSGLRVLFPAIARLQGKGIPLYIPHEHRLWEYASLLTTFHERFGETTGLACLDVGCGNGPLGAALALGFGTRVVEADPSERVARGKERLPALLGEDYTFHLRALQDLPERPEWDAVFCVSVMEHLPHDEQESGWRRLARLVRPGGLLGATVDYGPPDWANGAERLTHYREADLRQVLQWLAEEGVTVPAPDLRYHGAQVNDYTFFRILGEKR